jgi:uncharacterized protein (DUF58 family)
VTEPPKLVPPRRSGRAQALGRWPGAFGPRFFLALIVGLVWLGPAWWNPRFAYVLAAWDALVLILWWLDWRRLPRPSQLEIARVWSEPVALSIETAVHLEVSNQGGVPVEVALEDEVPPALRALPPCVELAAAPGGLAQAPYTLQPRARGDHQLGRVFIRYRSALRLAERRATADLRQSVRVYPNLQEARKLSLYLIRSRQIELEKRLQHRPERGREFESLRDYREGDDLRDICWTASARRAKLITKVYRAERSQTVQVVLDAGRLMLARLGSLTKLDYATTAALSLAQVALASGDAVGLLAYGRKVQARLAPARGAAHLRAMLDQLALARGELLEADHGRAADTLLSRQRRRSLVVWITDLAETTATPDVIENASRLTKHHLVLFVALGQPDLERLLSQRPESPTTMYRYVAGLELVHRRELLLRRLREQGALALEIDPGRLSTALVNQYLQVKEQSLL